MNCYDYPTEEEKKYIERNGCFACTDCRIPYLIKGEGMNLYKELWSRIGGRPWTYIWRDIYHQAEYVIQLLWFSVGVAIGTTLGWRFACIVWGIYTIGFIFGHFHWGTKYIEGQKGK